MTRIEGPGIPPSGGSSSSQNPSVILQKMMAILNQIEQLALQGKKPTPAMMQKLQAATDSLLDSPTLSKSEKQEIAQKYAAFAQFVKIGNRKDEDYPGMAEMFACQLGVVLGQVTKNPEMEQTFATDAEEIKTAMSHSRDPHVLDQVIAKAQMDQAEYVFKLPPQELEQLSQEYAELQHLPPDQFQKGFNSFEQQFSQYLQ